jgi:hypothetical protein
MEMVGLSIGVAELVSIYILQMEMVGLSIGVVEAPSKVCICGEGVERGDAHWKSLKGC